MRQIGQNGLRPALLEGLIRSPESWKSRADSLLNTRQKHVLPLHHADDAVSALLAFVRPFVPGLKLLKKKFL
jgi:hypothetical protein